MKICIVLFCAVFVVLGLWVPAAHAQLRVQVEEVYIVIDARLPNGDSIDGLTAGDFTIKQNGISVSIRGMEIQNKDIPREGPLALPFILCNKGCLTLDVLRQAANKFLTLLRKDDLTALYIMCPEPRQIAPFMSDINELQKVLGQIQLVPSCVPRLADMVTMATDDTVKLKETKKEHRLAMPMLSGDNMPLGTKKGECYSDGDDGADGSTYPCNLPAFDGPEFDQLVSMLRDYEIKFLAISRAHERPQADLARETGGYEISAHTLAGGGTSEAEAALKDFRTKNIPANRYTLMFTPVVFEGLEKNTIGVILSPKFGTPDKDYHLVVQKPCVRTVTNDCRNLQ